MPAFPQVDRPSPAENFGKVVSGQKPDTSSGASASTVDKLVTAVQAVIAFLTPFKEPRKWERLPLFGDWIQSAFNNCKPSLVVDPLGRVELRGWCATAAGAITTIAVLPINARPAYRMAFAVSAVNGGVRVTASIDVDTTGRVIWITPALGAGTEVSLFGVRFDTRV